MTGQRRIDEPVLGAAIVQSGLAQLGFDYGSSVPVKMIVFDPDLANFNHSPDLFTGVSLPGGESFQSATLTKTDQIVVEDGYFDILRK